MRELQCNLNSGGFAISARELLHQSWASIVFVALQLRMHCIGKPEPSWLLTRTHTHTVAAAAYLARKRGPFCSAERAAPPVPKLAS